MEQQAKSHQLPDARQTLQELREVEQRLVL
jgi:hypothetical protein